MSALERSLEDFERAVLAQAPVPLDRYDEEYFASEWRKDGNRYDLETRRRVEARNPELIKEAFRPERVLDVGCGPGFLMHLLGELGVPAEGIDGSRASLALAPASVRDRITVGPVTEPHVSPASYDLVVCREVLEHLTVLQIRQTVAQLCRASSRYVYVTTRFHPDPDGLLDFTSEPEVDPTHISLLAKDLLRCMFVLEGFRRRADLENAMDWARKGRVLVYERAAEA